MKSRIKINQIENKIKQNKNREKSIKPKAGTQEKINKVGSNLARLSTKREKTQITNFRNEDEPLLLIPWTLKR